MTKIMTADEATMTDGQIENAVNKLRDAMRKHRSEITSNAAQLVLGVENLGMMMFTPFRERAEAVSNLIVRTVKVNHTRSPQKALDATGRKQYTDRKVVATMPRGDGDRAELVFFKPDSLAYGENGLMSEAEYNRQLELRNLDLADPYTLCDFNAKDPTFADEHPHGTHWKNKAGQWCFATFSRWLGDERKVSVARDACAWSRSCWGVGLRK